MIRREATETELLVQFKAEDIWICFNLSTVVFALLLGELHFMMSSYSKANDLLQTAIHSILNHQYTEENDKIITANQVIG